MAPRKKDENRKYLMISAVSERYDIHPQTLRLYEREGLLQPVRSAGNTRLFDLKTLDQLERILFLTRELGVNLAGVEIILNLRRQLDEAEAELEKFQAKQHEASEERQEAVRPHHALVRVKARALVVRK